jgi:hypothetical protein
MLIIHWLIIIESKVGQKMFKKNFFLACKIQKKYNALVFSSKKFTLKTLFLKHSTLDINIRFTNDLPAFSGNKSNIFITKLSLVNLVCGELT